MLDSLIDTANMTLGAVLICFGSALIMGVLASFVYTRKNACSRSLAVTLALLPMVSAAIILVVNGNLGAGIAVAGAFSLVRFRSAQGSAYEILSVFLAMAIGLCCGAGYVGIAAVVLLLYIPAVLLLTAVPFGNTARSERTLRITIPEALDYEGLFDDVLARYTASASLESVRTAEMGSVYRLEYRITLKGDVVQRAMLDAIRTRNGNLEVLCGRVPEKHETI